MEEINNPMKDIKQIIAKQEEKWKKYANKHWQGNTENGKKIILHVDTDFGIDFHRSSIKEILEGVKQHYEQLPVFQEKYIDGSIGSPKIEKSDTINYLEEIIKKL